MLVDLNLAFEGVGYYSIARRCIRQKALVLSAAPLPHILPDRNIAPLVCKVSGTVNVAEMYGYCT